MIKKRIIKRKAIFLIFNKLTKKVNAIEVIKSFLTLI